MSIELVTAPAIEPVSLADAKAHLRVDTEDEDALITRLISAAREAAERATGRAFVAQSWRLWLDCWPNDWAIEIPRPPLIGVSSITTYDRNGNATVVDAGSYLVDAASIPGRVVFRSTALPPVNLRGAQAIAVEFDAGYGADAGDVPAGICEGILAWIAHLYESRGDAAAAPCAQAMISDLYPPEQRSTAQSFYAAGLNIGLMLAFFAGGYIAQHYGWRSAFLAAGLPGIALALLILLTLDEPKRGLSEARTDPAKSPAFGTTIRFLWSQVSYRFIVLGTAMSAFTGYGLTAFLPSFFVRSHHLAIAEIGLIFALILGLGGTAGTFLAGVIADKCAKYDMRWNLYVPALAVLISLPFWPIFFLSTNTTIAILAAIIPSSLAACYVGPCMAMMQGLAPLRMRATAAAIQLFIANTLGLGLGPQAIGALSDLLRPAFGENSLRYAMLTGVFGAVISAYCYWRAAQTLNADIANAVGYETKDGS